MCVKDNTYKNGDFSKKYFGVLMFLNVSNTSNENGYVFMIAFVI